ncbi:MAG: glycosyltransferase family 2 protein [Candidatus Tokpelaia sp.]|uniref:glycosyltransferase family 2 protein n=1 Tax=Candidatus Tokpelaia sp. TaxID=2233777 RepID=UPI00123986EE|nr:glycosyltransferase family 2 protein [Candidatus Tokpelaia sp.]KAA6206486.1 MAG: glycosyltransferase family 2 protein [Candidatus Tokpelaia sp.]KAA6206553.1 MAG: glycosyltransferase family 2 protein [Candidatus Tokpelaia sp.]KAA6405850.1 dolichol-phosphate mannosyltransferase [Candidatus Tokpelaia sp.]
MILSVLIPCKNEAENLDFLLDEIMAALHGRRFEIILIDDGSTDNIYDLIRGKALSGAPIRYIRHDKSAGKGAALRTGLYAAKGDIILTIDGDGQNDPVYLPQLADALAAAGPQCGIACGQRQSRTDSAAKQYASRFANRLRQKLLHDNTRDTACGLKAVYTHIFRRLPFFENWQRYFPALVKREGYTATHIDVIDRPRRFGQSKYGIFDRGLAGIADLAGVCWLMRRGKILPKAEETAMSAAKAKADKTAP